MKNFTIIILLLCCAINYAQQKVVDSVPYADGFRTVRLLLPQNYNSQVYPLIVMLDGQNLFDEKTSYAGEWNVDESIFSFPVEKQSIVIAIDHGNQLRMDELTPYPNEKYGGGKGKEFLQWIMNKTLPSIIQKYNLQVHPHKRAIAGSSLGGLFAHYAALMHPEYFQMAGVLSPSFWWSKEAYTLVNQFDTIENQHFFFAAGTEESDEMIPDMKRMHDLMLDKKATVSYLEEQGAKHNEAQWRATFLTFYYTFMNH